MELTQVLMSNYLVYSKGVIINRAIPSIDGLKPSQRRVLYTMYKMGLLNGNRSKSSNIVGQTMRLHPHGDLSTYEVITKLSVGNEALNVPYVDSKGNFGKVYSRDMAYAAPRYTEAKLTAICNELFEGIDEDAVEFIPNFDDTTFEPTLLPVKFPSILVNPSSGIAVGTSTDIPSFSLKNVCNATIGLLDGTVDNVPKLMEHLGIPEFTTGGYVHTDAATLNKLGEKGYGSFTVSGSVVRYNDRIEITEIPYGTTIESIIEDITEYKKTGELKEVTDVRDDSDLNGMKITIELRARANSADVLQKIIALTKLRMKMSFRTRVIIDNKLEELGLKELLEKWIEFRMATLGNIYLYRKSKTEEQIELLETWEKIKLDIEGVAKLLASKKEDELRVSLEQQYSLNDKQIDYLLNMRLKSLTTDNLAKRLNELDKNRVELSKINTVLSSELERKNIIIKELQEIRDKYGKDNKTSKAELIDETLNKKPEIKIDDSNVTVIMTKQGKIKRLVTIRDISNFTEVEGDEEVRRWFTPNDGHMLVFTYSGEVHKLLIDSIDASKGVATDEIYKLCGLDSPDEVLYVDAAGDYSGYFNIVFNTGRGFRVKYERAQGKRSKYVGLFDSCEPGNAFITKADKFFMITAKRKAAFCDTSLLGLYSGRLAFKVARISPGDRVFGLQPLENVPDICFVDIDRYRKPYTVNIGDDVLWEGAKTASEIKEERELAKLAEQQQAEEQQSEEQQSEEQQSEEQQSEETLEEKEA